MNFDMLEVKDIRYSYLWTVVLQFFLNYDFYLE